MVEVNTSITEHQEGEYPPWEHRGGARAVRALSEDSSRTSKAPEVVHPSLHPREN